MVGRGSDRSGENRSVRVLLVEDNPVSRHLAEVLLRQAGYEVAVAVDGNEAVKISAEREIDIVLMDVQLPEMDGAQAAAAMRKRERGGKRVPIIALTAHEMADVSERYRDTDFDAFIEKPYRTSEVLAVIERLLAS